MQQEMFPPSTQALVIRAVHDLDAGWHLSVAFRREGDRWAGDGVWTHYDHLTTSELVDVVMAELCQNV